MNILKDNLSGIASKRAYTAPTMELLEVNHQTDLLVCSPCEPSSGEDSPETIGVEEE